MVKVKAMATAMGTAVGRPIATAMGTLMEMAMGRPMATVMELAWETDRQRVYRFATPEVCASLEGWMERVKQFAALLMGESVLLQYWGKHPPARRALVTEHFLDRAHL